MSPFIGDSPSRELAKRLREAADEVVEPQRGQILRMLPRTLFISHTSLDNRLITDARDGSGLAEPGSILLTVWDFFYDPFFHNFKTGAAEAYQRIVGLSLLAATRILAIWSQNALQSDYVRAELLVASKEKKTLAVYLLPNAPEFPFDVPKVADRDSLRNLLHSWMPAQDHSSQPTV